MVNGRETRTLRRIDTVAVNEVGLYDLEPSRLEIDRNRFESRYL